MESGFESLPPSQKKRGHAEPRPATLNPLGAISLEDVLEWARRTVKNDEYSGSPGEGERGGRVDLGDQMSQPMHGRLSFGACTAGLWQRESRPFVGYWLLKRIAA